MSRPASSPAVVVDSRAEDVGRDGEEGAVEGEGSREEESFEEGKASTRERSWSRFCFGLFPSTLSAVQRT